MPHGERVAVMIHHQIGGGEKVASKRWGLISGVDEQLLDRLVEEASAVVADLNEWCQILIVRDGDGKS